jgi:hypothetical protein
MARFLDDLLNRLKSEIPEDATPEQAEEQRRALIAAAVAEPDIDLADVAADVVQRSGAVNPEEDITPAQVEYLQTLSEVSEGINAEVERLDQEQKAEARRLTAAALA